MELVVPKIVLGRWFGEAESAVSALPRGCNFAILDRVPVPNEKALAISSLCMFCLTAHNRCILSATNMYICRYVFACTSISIPEIDEKKQGLWVSYSGSLLVLEN